MYYTNPENKKSLIKKIFQKIALVFRHIRRWGHIKLSVMLVPHSEKKIFNFQISNFTIVFSSLLITGLIITSVFAIKRQAYTSRKKTVLQNENLSISKKLNSFIELTHKVKKSEKRLKKLLTKLIHNSGSAQNKLAELAFSSNPDKYHNALYINKEKKVKLVKEISMLKILINRVRKFNLRLNQLKTQITGFKYIMRQIPSVWPIFGGVGRFASGFGMRRDPFTGRPAFHKGVDIVTMPGHPVRATASGKVVAAKYNPTNGIYVDIQHNFGYMTNYSHLLRLNVKKDDVVKKGQIIGYVGTTGRSTGYHLHYEVRMGYSPINPAQFLYLDKFYR